MVVTLSHTGYIKSQPLAEYRAQRRGGRGKQATQTKEDDWVDQLFIANTHDYILCFSNRGRVYWLKVWEVPQGSRSSRGRPIVNMFPLQPGEKINVVLPLTGEFRSFPADHYVFMATAHGHGQEDQRSTSSATRARPASSPSTSTPGDYLIGAALTDGTHDVMLFSDGGKAVRFDENDVRPMGRNARGVRGMTLDDGQSVIAMLVAEDETQSVLTATENGYGKRTSIVEYTRHGRGTKGMIAIQQSERNGKVVAATLVRADDEIMLITDKGVLVRTRVAEIRELGRATQGVTLIALDDGAKLSGLQRIVENDANVDAGDRRRRRRRQPTPTATETSRMTTTSWRAGADRARRRSASPARRRRRARRTTSAGLEPGQEGAGAASPDALQQPDIESAGAQPRRAAGGADDAARPGWRCSSSRCRPTSAKPTGKAIEAEVKKYVDEAYPLVRDRALKLAPSTIGAALEAKMSEDELKQLLAWLESPADKKYQQLGRRAAQRLRARSWSPKRAPLVEPKLQRARRHGSASSSAFRRAGAPPPARRQRRARAAAAAAPGRRASSTARRMPASDRRRRRPPTSRSLRAADRRASTASCSALLNRRADVARDDRRAEARRRLAGVPARARGAGDRRR